MALLAASRPACGDELTFRNDVLAVLSKAGCNAGTCHGNLNGKGGFRLSLRAQDPGSDHRELVRAMLGRRVDRLQPDQSLILLKGTAKVPHQGGRRFTADSPEYEILHRWITEGARGPDQPAPKLVELAVTPTDQVVLEPDDAVQLSVVAHFSDGTNRDVTRMAVYEPTDMRVAVSPGGRVERQAAGVTTLLVRYLERQVPVRLAFVPAMPDFAWSGPAAENFIDEHIFARLQQLRINPAPLAPDHVFLRRIYLDLLGVLPTSDEARAFVADPSPEKRARLVDQLLARPEFALSWALKWADLLRTEEKVLDARGVQVMHEWIRQSFAEGKPLNLFVAELISAQGNTYQNPPTNYWRAHREPLVRAETTAQVFLGVRLQCAKCHNHPFDRWTQDEYYDWATLFHRIEYEVVENKRRDKLDKHEFVGGQNVIFKGKGELKNERTGKPAQPRLLGAGKTVEGERLEALAAWLSSPENRAFATAQANRIWYHLLGRGLVEPVDDFRLTNPASHPELLERLADELIGRNFDVRQLVRMIVLSRTYQLASAMDDQRQASPSTEDDYEEELYARAVIRRLTAEQLLDAQSHVLDAPAEFKDAPAGTRAGELPGGAMIVRRDATGSDGDNFLRLFGKPERLLSCECERSGEPTLGHALSLVGGRGLHERLTSENNRVSRLLAAGLDNEAIIDELFWTALARPPSDRELTAALEMTQQSDRRQALEDLTWALLNAKELVFRN